jgi:phosphatidylglycerophosphate synthase
LQLSQIELTYKSYDTEEKLDIIFYRPLGYYIALFSKKLGITPNAVTMLSILFGAAAGHLFYYTSLTVNVTGVFLLLLAETFDSADGQLARITGKYSKYGRILDGLGGNLMFLSIYIHLCLRLMDTMGFGIWIFGIALIAGLSHSYQSAMADYYRNAYMLFALNIKKSELDESSEVFRKFKSLSWSHNLFRKLLMMVYVNYTFQQELLSGNFRRFYESYKAGFLDSPPEWLRIEYKKLNKPLLKYYNILTTNTRMIVLFISVLSGYVFIYFAFELTVLNILLLLVIIKQEKNNKMLTQKINSMD